ncbi:MAG: DUF374 domain-containing protein [Planctomycetaceae bacterium]
MRIRSRSLNKLLAWLGVALLRLLFFTCRRVDVFEQPGTDACRDTGETRYLYAAWHDEILMLLFAGRPRNMAGLVSRHQDGSMLTDVLQAIDIAAVRGSSSREGRPPSANCWTPRVTCTSPSHRTGPADPAIRRRPASFSWRLGPAGR